MATQTEALKLALEALEGLKSLYGGNGHKLHEINAIHRNHDTAITAIKEALAQPEQEPVACIGYWNQKTGAYDKPDQISASHQKLIEDGILRRCYTTPPQRTWVGLTDEEINQSYADSYKGIPLHEGIEAKLKEKNGL